MSPMFKILAGVIGVVVLTSVFITTRVLNRADTTLQHGKPAAYRSPSHENQERKHASIDGTLRGESDPSSWNEDNLWSDADISMTSKKKTNDSLYGDDEEDLPTPTRPNASQPDSTSSKGPLHAAVDAMKGDSTQGAASVRPSVDTSSQALPQAGQKKGKLVFRTARTERPGAVWQQGLFGEMLDDVRSVCPLPAFDAPGFATRASRGDGCSSGSPIATYDKTTGELKATGSCNALQVITEAPHNYELTFGWFTESDFRTYTEEDAERNEFVIAKCNYQQQVFVRNKMKPEYFQRALKALKPNRKPINIAVILYDGCSRANFMRQMPETVKYMEDLEAVHNSHKVYQFMKYNIIEFNTLPNVGAFLTGQIWNWGLKVDRYLWDVAERAGYVSAFTYETCPENMFPIFDKGNADHNFSRLGCHMGIKPVQYTGSRHCLAGRDLHEWHFEYHRDFWDNYEGVGRISFIHLVESHEPGMTLMGAADKNTVNHLDSLLTKFPDDTVVILTADHGMAYGGFYTKEIGQVEHKLPPLFMITPKWLAEEVGHNLEVNQHRLVSAMDVHQTMIHMMHYPEREQRTYSKEPAPPAATDNKFECWEKGSNDCRRNYISLLDEIPDTRTCAQAGIPDTWCICAGWVDQDPSGPKAQEVGDLFADWLNQQASPTGDDCQTVQFVKANKMRQHVREIAAGADASVWYSKSGTGKQVHSYKMEFSTKTSSGEQLWDGVLQDDPADNDTAIVVYVHRISEYGQETCNKGQVKGEHCVC
eukprot:GFYU01009634.1.p1 GENE.GFYU01009634.1~~GFYU01009634.1.p1  ORF type:complete len:763 (+),score=189.10 GFYU01009634.1:201-2489(+)